MEWLLAAIATGVATAMATTFDDNVYLALFFSRTDRDFRPRHIVVGEFLGFTVLVAIGLSGFLVARFLDGAWIGLLGLVPIGIGTNLLLSRQIAADPVDQPLPGPVSATAARPRRSGRGRPAVAMLWATLWDPRTYRVTAVSIANGANNLAIYIPLFASCTLPRLLVVVAIGYGAVALWCVNGYLLTRQPHAAVLMSRVVRKAVPYLLMALGTSILVRSGTAQAFVSLATRA